jgi:hypothetical protein
MTSRSGPLAGAIALLLATVVAACDASGGNQSPSGSTSGLPVPTCGGLKIAIEGALPCDRVVELAVQALGARAPDQIARGMSAIDVVLAECPRGEVPPQITCGQAQFAQLVTVTFGPAGAGGPIEPSLTVAVEPATGAILGIENPLIR